MAGGSTKNKALPQYSEFIILQRSLENCHNLRHSFLWVVDIIAFFQCRSREEDLNKIKKNSTLMLKEEFMSNELKNFMGYMWLLEEDGIITLGINEEGLSDFEEISSVELPSEGDKVEADVVVGTIETDDGPLDIYSPVDGSILEVNSAVIEDPSLIQEDCYDEGWLIRIEAEDSVSDDEDEDEDDDEDEDEDSDEDAD